jgi:hypothetical protein
MDRDCWLDSGGDSTDHSAVDGLTGTYRGGLNDGEEDQGEVQEGQKGAKSAEGPAGPRAETWLKVLATAVISLGGEL